MQNAHTVALQSKLGAEARDRNKKLKEALLWWESILHVPNRMSWVDNTQVSVALSATAQRTSWEVSEAIRCDLQNGCDAETAIAGHENELTVPMQSIEMQPSMYDPMLAVTDQSMAPLRMNAALE